MSEQIHASGPMYRPSRDEDAGFNPAMTRRFLFGGGAIILVLLAIAGYRMIGHSGGDTLPVVPAVSGPLRVKPDNPGGMAVGPDQAPRDDPSQSRLAPGTEEPNPRGLAAVQDLSRPVPPLAAPRPKPVVVMLSATKSETEAQVAWDRLEKKMPDLLASHRPLFLKTNEPGPLPWRLRTGGFNDAAQAKAFCDKVKAKGGQCSVTES